MTRSSGKHSNKRLRFTSEDASTASQLGNGWAWESFEPVTVIGFPPSPSASTATPTATTPLATPTSTATPTGLPTTTPTRTPTPTGGALQLKINFQPADAPVPDGYLADTGAVFGDRGNGQRYGWSTDNRASTRDRNAANSPDQRYDTLIHMQLGGSFSWRLAVPNGSYSVLLVAGDPSYYDGRFKMSVEGQVLIDGAPSSTQPWLVGSRTVTVSDGLLTVESASGALNNKLAFIEVVAVSSARSGVPR